VKLLNAMLLRFRTESGQNRFNRFLNSEACSKMFNPHGWEPEVLKVLLERKWDGPVWDVGAALGRHALHVSQHQKVYAFEPNLNTLHYLGYNLRDCPNVVIVPCALTVDGKPMKGSFHPDFLADPTGPQVATLSLAEAIQKFGKPGVIKIDIEGGEYEFIKSEVLKNIPLLIEWHREVPTALPYWDIETIDPTHSLLIPKAA
jgi:FkbM family methyltransferase